MTQSRYLRLQMLSRRSSPWHKQPSCRSPQLRSSSRIFSNTAGCRSNCMTREVLALAVVAKAAKIISMVDSWRQNKERWEIATTQTYRQTTNINTVFGILTSPQKLTWPTMQQFLWPQLWCLFLLCMCFVEERGSALISLAWQPCFRGQVFTFICLNGMPVSQHWQDWGDPPICSCLKIKKHASLTHGGNKV